MDYVDLYMKSKLVQTSQVSLASMTFLGFCRIAPIVAMAPFFGARVLPHTVKVVLTLVLVMMIFPRLLERSEPLPFDMSLVLLAMKELFIGTILGFFVSLPFLIVSASGLLIDHQRGAASLMTNDPTIQNQTTPIGTLYNLMLIVIFYQYDGPFYVIDAVLDSYRIVPPDAWLSTAFFSPSSLLHERMIQAMQVFVDLMLRFAMPGLLIILMTDTFLGIINRLAPQVQITFLGMGLKSLLALFMVTIGWIPFVQQLGVDIVRWLGEFLQIIQELGYGGVSPPIPSPH